MRTLIRAETFTKTTRRAILYRLNRKNRYFYKQRYSLAPRQDLSADTLVQLLDDFFPGLVFIPKNNYSNISAARYAVQKHGKWTLDINAMSKAKERMFSGLFPEKISGWDEAEARKRYGCADIIRFFIDAENSLFSAGLSGSAAENREKAKNRGKHIPRRFFDELDYSGKAVWEDWDFSALVVHKMRRKPPGIYEAFGYYAHRLYTLLSLGLALDDAADEELIQAGTKLLNDAIQEQISGAANLSPNRLALFFEMIQETLESVPAGGSAYTPTKLDILIRQLKTRITGLYKNSRFGDDKEAYSAAAKRTINNHLEKAEKNVTDTESLRELRKVRDSGTYPEKINLLHRIVLARSVQGYSQREKDIIHGLYLKQFRAFSLDRQPGTGQNDDAYTGYDVIGDDKFASPEDHLAWSLFFRNEFAKELDSDALETFIECLPEHFSQYPFDTDAKGNLRISKYSRKMLFSTFCSAAGIFQDNDLWKPFLVLLNRVVENINKSRKM